MVSGRLVQRTFETDGQRRTTVEIQVQHVAAGVHSTTVEIKNSSAGDARRWPSSPGDPSSTPATA